MAAGSTEDTRIHVLGDMVMLTGTFTDGGHDVYFGDTLDTVFAAGGHLTDLWSTGVITNGAKAVGDTTFTVKTVDMRFHWNVGETVYDAAGDRIGVISAMAADATGMTLASVLKAIDADVALYKLGAPAPAVTLMSGNLDVAIDETNKYVVFGTGNMGAASTTSAADGRWWILGKR